MVPTDYSAGPTRRMALQPLAKGWQAILPTLDDQAFVIPITFGATRPVPRCKMEYCSHG